MLPHECCLLHVDDAKALLRLIDALAGNAGLGTRDKYLAIHAAEARDAHQQLEDLVKHQDVWDHLRALKNESEYMG
jgi:hypothetical protein